jgi:hypothetical protein
MNTRHAHAAGYVAFLVGLVLMSLVLFGCAVSKGTIQAGETVEQEHCLKVCRSAKTGVEASIKTTRDAPAPTRCEPPAEETE